MLPAMARSSFSRVPSRLPNACTSMTTGSTMRSRISSTASLTSGRVATVIAADIFAAENGRRLRWESGVAGRGADLLHLGAARSAECVEFLTMDSRLLRQVGAAAIHATSAEAGRQPLGIRVALPGDTICLPQEYRQRKLFGGGTPPHPDTAPAT
jgi:hypothetical protein